jgi:tRNA threonylcarbamoyladenosine biosynthesis protein TsaE
MIETSTTSSEAETILLGREFARRLILGDVVALNGELGSGKTQFIKGVCLGLGVSEIVASPSFVIMNEYKAVRNGAGTFSVYHFDFYRVKSLNEIYDLGIEEYLYGRGICVIEWAKAAEPLLPKDRYEVSLCILGEENIREIRIERIGESGNEDRRN